MPPAAPQLQPLRPLRAPARALRLPARLPRPEPPDAIARDYGATLGRVADLVREAIAPAVEAAVAGLEELRAQQAQDGLQRADAAPAPSVRQQLERAAERVAGRLRAMDLDRLIASFGKRVAEHSRAQVRRQVGAVLSVPLEAIERPTRDRIPDWARENAAIIKTIPGEYLASVGDLVREAYAGGMRPETLRRRIEERYGVAQSVAQRIARTETSRLNAAVTRDRHESLGIEWYTWRTMRDERVSEEHAALDGHRFRYDKPPPAGRRGEPANPGEAIHCRCFAEPDLTPLVEGAKLPPERAPRAPKAPPEPVPLPAPVPLPPPVPRAPGEFETVEHAEEWARAAYPQITWTLTGGDPKALNPTLAQFDKLAKAHPAPLGRLQAVTIKPLDENIYAWAFWDGHAIELSAKHFGDNAGFKQKLERDAASGWHPPGTEDPASVLTHEYGHMLDFALRRNMQAFSAVRASGFGTFSETYEMWRREVQAKMEPPSRYGAKDEEEKFAEGFASLFHTPPAQQSAYTKKLGKFLREIERLKSEKTPHAGKEHRTVPEDERMAEYERLKAIAKRLGLKDKDI